MTNTNSMGLQEIYFDWMSNVVMPNTNERYRYRYLLEALNASIFHFSIPMDENRMRDGIDLRYRFAYENGYSDEEVSRALNHNRSCSMLEMMVALAIKGDERILYDYETGNRADYIFRVMLESLDLIHMTNDNFYLHYVEYRIDCLLNREYDYDGRGGLFTVENPRRDMRLVDIWYQMNWYLEKLYNNN